MSPKRRRVSPPDETHANAFLEKLKSWPPLVPTILVDLTYTYGALPFAIDWEVWRVSEYTTIELDEFAPLIPRLQQNVDKPKIIWQILESHAAKYNMPPPSSTRVWELLHTKGWFDGRVHFTLTLECSSKGGCRVTPRPMMVAESRRAYRKYGSQRFIALTMVKDTFFKNQKKVGDFLRKPLSVCGRTYYVFFVKPSTTSFTVHYFATQGAGLSEIHFDELMEWLLSLNKNYKMSAAKLWSRIPLALSSTRPTICFAREEIRLIGDIKSVDRECMTDGCAKASPAVFREIWRSGLLDTKETPTAVQGRIGGAKGVWYVDPTADPRSDEIWVEIRDSQLKLKFDPVTFEDPMLRTLVCSSQVG
jgi:RNA dependent RNA polymerase